MAKKRNYPQEYEKYHKKKKQKKRRAQRNKTRRKLLKSGRVRKYDKKDIHHKDRNTKNISSKNLRVTSRKYNRSRNS